MAPLVAVTRRYLSDLGGSDGHGRTPSALVTLIDSKASRRTAVPNAKKSSRRADAILQVECERAAPSGGALSRVTPWTLTSSAATKLPLRGSVPPGRGA